MPLDAPVRRLTIAIEEPAEYTASLLTRLLQARGVKIDGHARARHVADSADAAATPQTILAEHTSVPLSGGSSTDQTRTAKTCMLSFSCCWPRMKKLAPETTKMP